MLKCFQNEYLRIFFTVFNDGSKMDLVNLQGTIPIKYKGKIIYIFFINLRGQLPFYYEVYK